MLALESVSLTFPPPKGSLRDRMSRAFGVLPDEDMPKAVTALRDVAIKIERGERVGIIGFNGAGKTTLLKVMCGIYAPSVGRVVVEGDIACLFELATGFEMEATGWENILTRGLLLGLSRAEIRDRMRDIAAFTELGAALDRPLKTYSAGMFVRLAFAVSTSISPDVLLLDEVIAAGDVRFHEKARRRLEEMVQRASILVLVSHSMETVRQMCRRAIWLSEGTVRLDGPADEVTAAYERGAAAMAVATTSSGSSA
jgi:ABC-type polysaccharide/polyol phosphate transport system ATPase subunit